MEKVLCDLVRLFPKSFRERFGAEMEQVIAHGYRRSRATGRACAVGYALRTGIGITVNAFLTWGELALRENKTTSLDLRSARRSLLRTPSYAAVMILVVAVVVSIAVVVAAYCRGTLFRDPAYRDPARLVFVWGSNVVSGQRRDVVSGPNFLDLREAGRTVESLAAIHGSSAVALRDGRPWILATLDVSVDFLGVLGVVPALGQDFSDVHRDSTGPDAVIVSHRFWKDDLDGDPNVIGATIPLDGRAHSIVGVLPSDFEFLAPFPLLRPLGEDVLHQEDRTYHNYWMVGRLERGAAPSDATRELSAVLARIAKDDDPRLLGWSVLVEPMLGVSLEAVRPLLLTLGAAVLLVAIAASLNLATLSLVRTFGRSREIFTRSVLGAGRRGAVRIVLLETGVLCGLGTWLGLGGGVGLVDALGGVVPAYVPIPGSAANVRVVHSELDTFVVGAAVAVAVAMWVLVVLPALLHTHALTAAPSVGARATSSQHAARKLVVAELALATLLLVFAGLLDRTASSLLSVDPGVEPAGLLTMYVGQLRDPAPEVRARYFRDVVLEVERTPGVVRAGVSDYVPFQGEDDFMGFRLLDRPPPPPGEGLREEWRHTLDQ